ncbi:MAG: hypothetical protein AABW89_04645 [Nanoarchaeota archaeon]
MPVFVQHRLFGLEEEPLGVDGSSQLQDPSHWVYDTVRNFRLSNMTPQLARERLSLLKRRDYDIGLEGGRVIDDSEVLRVYRMAVEHILSRGRQLYSRPII